jgi:hypothetical protein
MPDEKKPPRVTLTNLTTGRGFSAQFNPTELEETVSANYNELKVLGMSHAPLQYTGTSNWEGTFSLGFDALATYAGAAGAQATVWGARRFLQSLLYPSAGGQGVAGGAPPDVRLLWPTLLALTCKLKTVKFKHSRFNSRLQSCLFVADVTVVEARDVRLYSEDVLGSGTMRS